MSQAPTCPPILLIGMHRSGTSLLARMLEDLGMFMGWRLAANHEASFFNGLNAWLLSSAGGRWDTPLASDYLRADPVGRDLAVAYLRDRLAAPPALEFLGPGRYLRHGSLFGLQEPWGFKDPRTTVLLDLWLEVFPEAKVLHLVRNGVDVADSLVRRQRGGLELGRRHFEKYRRLFRWRAKQGWFGTSPRVLHLEEAFRLWEEYLELADRLTEGLGDALLEARYETLLANPSTEIERILAFCHLEPDPELLATTLQGVRTDRAFGFLQKEETRLFWQKVRGSRWMRHWGYESLDSPT